MTYDEGLRSLPYNPQNQLARGIVAPLVRCTTHLADILSDLVNNRAWTEEDQQAGMDQLRAHAAGIEVTHPTVSDATNVHLGLLFDLLISYTTEFPSWSHDRPDHLQSEAVRNTQAALDRIAGIASRLDQELAAVHNADPGRDV